MKSTIIILMMVAALVSITPSLAGMENITINITSPEEGDEVEWRNWVIGETNLKNYTDYHIYVIINPADSGTWWVQPKAVIDTNTGIWRAHVYFGREGMDWGSYQFVCAIITASKLEYNTFDNIPENIAKSDIIMVRRK
ncbi:hypothetical protein [Methanothrix harundinacea]|uniref:Uncharacterized protein n=1 Tax=Methanothrix harundinacea (strain 6Ac) TaxID=1110509 RepID=G7WP32_METH6|nr:hypothetical protein [Methanothrix harundinacea]AET64873.1 hypothetical protein Mhar_1509 [Methanothrix harundinacea 6Ac]